MRVAHVITGLDVGGAELMLARLVEKPAGLDHVAVLSLSGEGALGGRIRRAGVPVIALGMRPGRVSLAALLRLTRELRRLKPDVVQTWLYHADFIGLIAARLAGISRVVWNLRCAELDPRDHPGSLLMLIRLLSKLSRVPSAVIANSAAGKRAHEELGYAPRRWAIIPNGFDVERFAPDADARAALRDRLGLPRDGRVVGLLGRLHPMKDHATFLRAAARVVASDAGHGVHIIAAGRDVATDPAIAELVHELGLDGRVTLEGETPEPERLLAALDVAVLSSYGEAFPNVVGEAMACGTPVVATDVGDAALVVGETGVIVPARDPEALASGIISVLELPADARERLGEGARARIMSDFSMDAAAARYLTLYAELVREEA